MLFFGWMYGAVGVTDSEFYNAMVAVFYGALRFGGLLMLVVAGLCYFGVRAGLIVDVVVTGGCGLVMIAYGLAGLTPGVGIGTNNLLALIFGAVFLTAAHGSLRVYRGCDGRARPVGLAAPPAPEPVHPASIHPPSLPEADEPPPPEGYLAALSKEEDEPPSASYE